MFHPKKFFKSFAYAGRGIREVWIEEQSFRVLFFAFFFVILAAVLLRARLLEILLIAVFSFGLLVLECLNSAMERLVDMVKPGMDAYVKSVKDIMAGAVLLASLGVFLAVLIILWPYAFVLR